MAASSTIHLWLLASQHCKRSRPKRQLQDFILLISKAESPDESWSDVQLNSGESIQLPFDITMLFGIGLDNEQLPDSDSPIQQD